MGKRAKAPTYFSDLLCKKGHRCDDPNRPGVELTERLVKSNRCVQCTHEYLVKWRERPGSMEKVKANQNVYRDKPGYTEKNAEAQRRYRESHPERQKEYQREYNAKRRLEYPEIYEEYRDVACGIKKPGPRRKICSTVPQNFDRSVYENIEADGVMTKEVIQSTYVVRDIEIIDIRK